MRDHTTDDRKRKHKMAAALCVLALVLGAGIVAVFIGTPGQELDAYPQLHSANDEDGDGIDDQVDILQGARAYVATSPKYESKYYAGGYPDDNCGVCTDVAAFALKAAGYDLRALLSEDVANNLESYGIETPDANIDFRRVRNQRVYFERHAISLTTSASSWEDWQGGDIVTFEDHVGIVSSKRSRDGRPYLIHLAPFQLSHEEDALEHCGAITGHFRISE